MVGIALYFIQGGFAFRHPNGKRRAAKPIARAGLLHVGGFCPHPQTFARLPAVYLHIFQQQRKYPVALLKIANYALYLTLFGPDKRHTPQRRDRPQHAQARRDQYKANKKAAAPGIKQPQHT